MANKDSFSEPSGSFFKFTSLLGLLFPLVSVALPHMLFGSFSSAFLLVALVFSLVCGVNYSLFFWHRLKWLAAWILVLNLNICFGLCLSLSSGLSSSFIPFFPIVLLFSSLLVSLRQSALILFYLILLATCFQFEGLGLGNIYLSSVKHGESLLWYLEVVLCLTLIWLFFYHYSSTLTQKEGALLELNQKLALDKETIDENRGELRVALAETLGSFRDLIEASPFGIAVLRQETVIYVNATAIKMFGASDSEALVGQKVESLVDSSSLKLVESRIKVLMQGSVLKEPVEEVFKKLDGTAFQVLVQSTPIHFEGQAAILTTFQDITEQRRLEKKASEKEEHLHTIFETLSEGVALNEIVYDATGEMIDYRIVEVNRAFYEIADYDKKLEVIGALATKLYRMPGETIQYFWNSHRHQTSHVHNEYFSEANKRHFMISVSPFKNNRFITSFHDITARKQNENEIKTLAFYDALTGLPNRRHLLEQLESLLAHSYRYQKRAAILFIDLDHFKTLNDTHGHAAGDQLLKQVAERIKLCVRETDVVARLGGDEFVVMMGELSQVNLEAATQARVVGEKILVALAEPFFLAGLEYLSSPSIGATLFGEEQESLDEPLKRADLAMYQAKSSGRNTFCFFDPEMQAAVNKKVALEKNLRHALQEKQFKLFYQAQINHEGALIGVEALVRWEDPGRGLISPMEFIPLAEETRLILPLGNWVLRTACEQLVKWASDDKLSALTIAVNISAKQFYHEGFVDEVIETLRVTGATPQLLKLEITESVLISNTELVIVKMKALQDYGIQFSLDDFGTGYSSLSYLKILPFNQLKIDQSFVREILNNKHDGAIAKMILSLAESLDLHVVAEGVETKEQHEFLSSLKCHAFQGYLFNQPLAIDKFEAVFRTT